MRRKSLRKKKGNKDHTSKINSETCLDSFKIVQKKKRKISKKKHLQKRVNPCDMLCGST